MSGTFNARKACEAVVARIGGGEVPFLHKSPDRPAFSGFAGIKKITVFGLFCAHRENNYF